MIPGFPFHDKPLLIGDRALHFYGITEEPGKTVDLVVSPQDFDHLRQVQPAILGERIKLGNIRYYRHLLGFSYEALIVHAIPQPDHFVASLPTLLFVLATIWGSDSHNEERRPQIAAIIRKLEEEEKNKEGA